MPDLPVEQDDGCILLRFDRCSEDDLDRLDPVIPLTAALVVLWHDDDCLLVFNRFRMAWELPGGMIDPGESAREAAFRELVEESGQRPDGLDFAGVARVWYAPAQRLEHLAIYQGRMAVPSPFTPNEEMSDSVWWNPAERLDGLNPIDGALADLCSG
jgi:8-oxo-dGTP diphosphatase